jgi:hypothetical protein
MMVKRIICRVTGHRWTPWTRITLLKLSSKDCLRCGIHAMIDDNQWYTEYRDKKLITKGYL